MSAQVQPQSPPQGSERQETSITSRKQKDKQLPPAALETQPSRRKRGRSSLSSLVSRILPSRRAERGHTLRNEFKDDGSLSAADLVFGIIEPPGPANKQALNDPEEVVAVPFGATQIQDHRPSLGYSDGMERASAKSTNGKEIPSQSGGNGRVKGKKGLGRLLSLKTTPRHGEDKQVQSDTASQQEPPQFHLPSFNFEKDALPLDFQKPSDDKDGAEVSKTQQMFETKKARREQRRSLLESGDFLGIQGANPRTGYWDVSEPTSSSEPSQQSYETKKKLEELAKDVDKQKVEYERAQAKYSADLARVQSLKEKREAEKSEVKKRRLKLKQRRYGKWNAGDNGWSSVAEPDLSPIRQSLVGSPVKETAPADKLFPMPSGDNPTPYADNSIIDQQDYFGRQNLSSPPGHGHHNAPVELDTGAPSRNNSIPRKPVPPRRQNDDSSDTILRHDKALEPRPDKPAPSAPPPPSTVKNGPPGKHVNYSPTALPEPIPPFQQSQPFLDKVASMGEPGGPHIKEAIATSYLLVLMSQVPILPRFFQSLEDISHRGRTNPLSRSPPACCENRMTGRNPSTPQLLKRTVSI